MKIACRADPVPTMPTGAGGGGGGGGGGSTGFGAAPHGARASQVGSSAARSGTRMATGCQSGSTAASGLTLPGEAPIQGMGVFEQLIAGPYRPYGV